MLLLGSPAVLFQSYVPNASHRPPSPSGPGLAALGGAALAGPQAGRQSLAGAMVLPGKMIQGAAPPFADAMGVDLRNATKGGGSGGEPLQVKLHDCTAGSTSVAFKVERLWLSQTRAAPAR